MNKSQYHHGNLKQALLDQALIFLNAHDQAQLSLRELARVSGVSPNAPYRHFKTKENLLLHLAELGFDKLGQSLDEVVEEGPMKRFRALGECFVRFAQDNGRLFELMFALKSDGREESNLTRSRSRCYSTIEESVRVIMGELVVTEKVSASAATAWSLFFGFSYLANLGSLPASTPEAFGGREVSRILARGLRD